MRALFAVVVLSVATVHSALSASLEGAEKEEKEIQYDGLVELLKVDQMEFEAAQKGEAAQMNEPMQYEAAQKEDTLIVNVTVGDSEDARYLEAVKHEGEEQQGPADVNTGGDGHSEAALSRDETQSKSTEETKVLSAISHKVFGQMKRGSDRVREQFRRSCSRFNQGAR